MIGAFSNFNYFQKRGVIKIVEFCGTYCATPPPAERHSQLSADIHFSVYIYEESVSQPPAERALSAGATWLNFNHNFEC